MKIDYLSKCILAAGISAMLLFQSHSALAATNSLQSNSAITQTDQTIEIDGSIYYVQIVNQNGVRSVKVINNGITTSAVYNKTNDSLQVVNGDSKKQSVNISSYPFMNYIHPINNTGINLTENVRDLWYGDEAQNVVTPYKHYLLAMVNDSNSATQIWTGIQNNTNESAFNAFWSSVQSTLNAEYTLIAIGGGAITSGAVSVILASTGVGAVIAGIIALGFTITMASYAAMVFNDHNSDVYYFNQIPRV